MIVTFEESYLQELYINGKSKDKKHRYQPEIIKLYQRRIDQLRAAPGPETLYQINSLNFEALVGDKAGRFSIRVNNKYRVEFTLNTDPENPILSICNITELSNHYD